MWELQPKSKFFVGPSILICLVLEQGEVGSLEFGGDFNILLQGGYRLINVRSCSQMNKEMQHKTMQGTIKYVMLLKR